LVKQSDSNITTVLYMQQITETIKITTYILSDIKKSQHGN